MPIHHLTLEDRTLIEQGIKEGKTKKAIAKSIGKDPAGLAHEIRRHREFKPRSMYTNSLPCAVRQNCGRKCVGKCDKYIAPKCQRRDKSPGACNGCEKRGRCRLDKYLYNAKRADATYREMLIDCREGVNLTEEERDFIGKTFAPLLKKGQSVYQVLENHPQITVSARSMYTYIECGVFKDFGIDNFALKEQVNRKQWSKKYKKRKEPANFKGRKYEDYVAFMQEHPDISAVEMDTVYNNPSGPYLQTFMFPPIKFMIGRLHNEKTNESMSSGVDYYQEQLGYDDFTRFFQVLLTDRGSEFEKFYQFEKDKQGNSRLNIFYCDPMQSAQKPHCENNHNYVRDIIPNSADMGKLSQADIDLMFSHINSTPRASLNGKTPYELFVFYFGTEFAQKLNVSFVAPDDVTLSKSLVFKKD